MMSPAKPLGLEEEQTQFIQKTLIKELKKFNSLRVFVFGSRALGNFRKYSDLDLWIEASTPIPTATLSKLRQTFNDSDLPIKIDLVTPETCLEEYRSDIETKKKLWFAN